MYKRIVSLLLVLVMALSIVPVPARAQEGTSSTGNSDVTIEGENSFGSLLSNTVEGSQEEQPEEDYEGRVCDLVIEGTYATVEYASPVDADVVVAIYTQDGAKLLGSGTVSAPAEETIAQVEIDIPVMPYYFKAAAYLLDARDHTPLSQEFRTDRYTKTMQDILSATVDDFNPELVLNLDGDRTTNFAVFNENTLLSKDGSDANVITDNGGGVYTITNADERFLSMKPGDTFAHTYPDGTVLIVNAASVQVDGTTVTVTENTDAELSDVFDFVKIEEDSYGKDITFDESVQDECFTTIDKEELTVQTRDTDKEFHGSFQRNVAIDYGTGIVKLGGSFGWGLTLEVKVYITPLYQNVSVTTDLHISSSLHISGELARIKKALATVRIPLAGGVAAIVTPSFVFSCEVEGSFSVGASGAIIVSYDSGTGKMATTTTKPKFSMDESVDLSGKAFIGIEVGVGFALLDERVAEAELKGQFGVEVSAENRIQSATASTSVIHGCEKCCEGNLEGVVSFSTELSVFKFKRTDTLAELRFKLTDFYYSFDYKEGGATACPHLVYKTTVKVFAPDNMPVAGAAIQVLGGSVGSEWTDSATILDEKQKPAKGTIPLTDSNGQSVFYLPKGTYAFAAECDSQRQEISHVAIQEEPRQVVIELGMPSEPKEFTLSQTSADMLTSDKPLKLTAMYGETDVTNACRWETSDPQVVTVIGGALTPVGTGTATVTARYTADETDYEAVCQVTVAESALILSQSVVSLKPTGNSVSLTAQFNGEDVTAKCTWTTSDPQVVTVSGGTIRPVAEGSAVITASFTVNGQAYTDQCQVTVSENVEPQGPISGSCGLNVTWNFDKESGVLTISGTGPMYDYREDDAGDYLPRPWKDLEDSITSIVINQGVTRIGKAAFSGIYWAKKVSIPSSVTSIGNCAFDGCWSLNGITIPDSVTVIEFAAFSDCRSLTSIVLPNGLETIEFGTFMWCENLKSVIIPVSVTTIELWVFDDRLDLPEIYYMGSTSQWNKIDFMSTDDYENPITKANIHFNADIIKTGTCGSGLKWTFNRITGELSISGTGAMFDYETDTQPWKSEISMIHSICINKGVTSIGRNAFYNCYAAAEAVISNGVVSIGDGAFAGCQSLTSIVLPSSLTSIGELAFYYCVSLTRVELPNHMTAIGSGAFYQCRELESIKIPNGLTTIHPATFACCYSLTEAVLPSGVTSIGDEAFLYCFALTSVKIPGSVTAIGKGSFRSCSKLSSITIPGSVRIMGDGAFSESGLTSVTISEGVTEIGAGAFRECYYLKSVSIPKTVTAIGDHAFYYCYRLDSVAIPKGVTTIGNNAFDVCYGLISINLPTTLTEIGDQAFLGCSSLVDASYPGTWKQWCAITMGTDNQDLIEAVLSSNDIASGKCGDKLNWKFNGSTGTLSISGTGKMYDYTLDDNTSCWKPLEEYITSIHIANGTTKIGNYAFSNIGMFSIIIPESVTTIGSGAFINCFRLESITIPKNVKVISDSAFACSGLKNVDISKSVTTIANGAFASCYQLNSIVIPQGVTTIGDYAFGSCNNLTSVTIPKSVTSLGMRIFGDCSGLNNVTILSGVTSIGEAMFYGCSSLNHIILPESITTIGKWAFEGSGLKSFTWPSKVKTIEYGTFMDCADLTDVTIPESVTAIGDYVFQDCTSLTSVTIPKSVQSIGEGIFYNCTGLANVSIESNITAIEAYMFYGCSSLTQFTIPESVKTIGKLAFWGCSSLTEIILPEGVTTIREHTFDECTALKEVTIQGKLEVIETAAFQNCTNLTGFTIPESVTTLGGNAFWGCRSLTSIAIPDGITEIQQWTFEECDRLARVVIPKTVKSIGEGAFHLCPKLTDVTYSGTRDQWMKIAIHEVDNGWVSTVTIYCSDGDIAPGEAMATLAELPTEEITEPTGEVTEPTEETTEPTEEATEAPTEEPTEAPTEAPTEVPTEAPTEAPAETPTEAETESPAEPTETETPVEASPVSGWQWSVLPQGARMEKERVQLLSAFSGSEKVKNGVRTTSFTGLEPGERYVLIVSIVPGSLVAANLQYIDQGTAAADGSLRFSYIPREDVSAVVQVYGVPAQREITLDRDYITMEAGSGTEMLTASVTPESWGEELTWQAENPEGEAVITVSEFGEITPVNPGTAYAVATVRHGKYVFSARCRVDVTERRANLEVKNVQLADTAATVELFRTDYTALNVVLELDQNQTNSISLFRMAPQMEDNGVAITGASFADPAAAAVFDLAVQDDRTLLVVPKAEAIENPGTVGKTYTSRVAVQVRGAEYMTPESVKLTVKKTLPRLKANSLTFNSFYTGQSQPIQITGATVTEIQGQTPSWLTLEDGVLTLTPSAPRKSASGKVTITVQTQEWAVPANVTVSAKLTYKAPGLKLSASSLTLASDYAGSRGAAMKLLCKSKTDTLEKLRVSDILAPEGFAIQDLDLETGGFTLIPTGPIASGSKTISVCFYDTDECLPLTVKVSAKALALTVKPASVTLNSVMGDSADITVTGKPADHSLESCGYRLITGKNVDAQGQLDVTYEAGRLHIQTNANTLPGATYKLYLSIGGSKEKAVTVKTLAEKKAVPSLTLKATGTVDLSFPESAVTVKPVFKNYFSGESTLDSWSVGSYKGKTLLADVTERFRLEEAEGGFQITRKDGVELKAGNYTLSLSLTLPDGNQLSKTATIKVKRTAVKLKLSKTSLNLNKAIGESAGVGLTCTTKNYRFTQPVMALMDGKGKTSAEGMLDVSFQNGTVTVAVNDKTRYGDTYKLLLRATEADTPASLTVKIPAQSKSGVTASLKISGTLDVIRDSTFVTVTPAYKNYVGQSALEKTVTVRASRNGKQYTEDVTELFRIQWQEKGGFTVAKAPGAQLDTGLKYRVELSFPEAPGSAAAVKALTVKSGKASVKLGGEAELYRADQYSRAGIPFTVGDKTLNSIARVEIKDKKLAALYQIHDYGGGQFAIGFKDDTVSAAAKSCKLALNVYLDGNATTKPSATVTLKLNVK